jgi:hypothetical protein
VGVNLFATGQSEFLELLLDGIGGETFGKRQLRRDGDLGFEFQETSKKARLHDTASLPLRESDWSPTPVSSQGWPFLLTPLLN